MRTPKHRQFGPGVLLIEIILAVAITSIITLIILTAFIYAKDSTNIAGDRSRAVEIANMTVAAVNNISQDSFSNLSSYTDGTSYYIDISGSQWSLSTTPTTIDNLFMPTIIFGGDPSGNRSVNVTVTWQANPSRTATVSVTSYLTDWRALTLLPIDVIKQVDS